MNTKEYEKIRDYTAEVMRYFSELKKEREENGQELTPEEHHLLLSSLGVRQSFLQAYLRNMKKQERIREENQARCNEKLFLDNEIVYEGIVNMSEIYNPVYASDYKELKKKMSKLANLMPQDVDYARVKTYQYKKVIKEETWIRKNALKDGMWSFGKWEQMKEEAQA